MSLIKKITPINVSEEKNKFLSDENYQPSFVYREPIDQTTLFRYGKPKIKLVELAKQVVEKSFFGRNEMDLMMSRGRELSQSETHEIVAWFLKKYHLEKRFEIVWSSSFVSKASITPNTIKLRLPCTFREEGLIGTLYHEIGTHALRRINYEQQPWYKKKKKYGFANYLKTEEGLATLHSHLPKSIKLLHSAARRYLFIYWAQQLSFAELNQRIKKFVPDPNRRWNFLVRAKRGIEDSSQPGGFTKDLLYFEGAIEVWQWLKNHDFDVNNLYFGKMALADVEKAKKLNPNFSPVLPHFFTANQKEYAANIFKIGKENYFDQI